MRIDGKTPIKGLPGDRAADPSPAPKAGGKSFGAALRKASDALAGSAPQAPVPNAPADGKAPASGTAAPIFSAPKALTGAEAPADSPENHLETIRFRMKTGYYDSKSINDALTDKLTGFFDDLA